MPIPSKISTCRSQQMENKATHRGHRSLPVCKQTLRASKLLGLCAGFRSLDHKTQVSVWPVKVTPEKQFRWGWVAGWCAGQSGSLCWVYRTIRVLNNGRYCLPTSGKETMTERGDLGSELQEVDSICHGKMIPQENWQNVASHCKLQGREKPEQGGHGDGLPREVRELRPLQGTDAGLSLPVSKSTHDTPLWCSLGA